MPIVITPSTNGVAGKLADAEIHFTKGPLAGLKLVGFALWESQWPDKKTGQHVRVTMPSREYDGRDGERKRYDLLRPVNDQDKAAGAALRDAILAAFQAQEGQTDTATRMARQTWREAQQPVPVRRTPVAAPRVSTPAVSAAASRSASSRQPEPLRRVAGAGRPRTDSDDYPF